MASYLLPLSTLHAAAPEILDVVFGPDGSFEGPPRWGGPITIDCGPRPAGHAFVTAPVEDDGLWLSAAEGNGHKLDRPDFWPWSLRLALDLRVPSVAARLAGLCSRCRGCLSAAESGLVASAFYASVEGWTEEDGARLAALTLALAPRIAALRPTS